MRFRVSPSSFFQTNSAGAAVLYKTIAEKCGLYRAGDAASAKLRTDATDAVAVVSEKDLEECTEGSEEPETKKMKLDKVMKFFKSIEGSADIVSHVLSFLH